MAEWKEKTYRSGSIEWKLDCPLKRGQFRPLVVFHPDWPDVIATAISGYTRKFETVEAAKEWAGRVTRP